MESKMIYFKEVSWPCKIGIIGGWAVLVIYVIAFLIGFIGAFVGA